jgi:hypothetical protein
VGRDTFGGVIFDATPSSQPQRPLPNTYWVIPGRFLAGEYPGADDDATAGERLRQLAAAGVDSFVDLTEEGELPPYSHLLPRHIDYMRSAIVDTSVPNTIAQTTLIVQALRGAHARGRCVYVHCRAGIGRTGLVVGCFLAEAEGNGKAALKLLNRLWRQSDRSRVWPTVPQTAEQADYVRRWPKLAKHAP